MKSDVTGSGMAYLVAGTGRPLIFIHGWSMAAPVWQRQLDYFSGQGFESVAIDLGGHGKSLQETPCTVSQLAYDLKGFIHERGYEKPVLVGWSMGAMVAMEFAMKHQGIAGGLCLVGGVPRFTEAGDYPHGLPLKDVKGMKKKLKRDFERAIGEFRESITDGLSDDDKDILTRAILPSPDAARQGLEELMEVDLRSGLEKIKVPTLLIHGAADRVALPAASRYMSERIKDSRLIVMDDAGHVPFLSHQHEFNEALGKFLRRI